MTTKLLSMCCKATAKVDMSGASPYFCTSCGKGCGTTTERTGFGSKPSTLSTKRKPTGERDLFIQLYAKCQGRSEVSGEKLLPPEHPMFHFQGSHCLPKGTYPDYRLDPRNIAMVTVAEHEYWHGTPKGILLADPNWAPIVARYKALQAEAESRNLEPKQ